MRKPKAQSELAIEMLCYAHLHVTILLCHILVSCYTLHPLSSPRPLRPCWLLPPLSCSMSTLCTLQFMPLHCGPVCLDEKAIAMEDDDRTGMQLNGSNAPIRFEKATACTVLHTVKNVICIIKQRTPEGPFDGVPHTLVVPDLSFA